MTPLNDAAFAQLLEHTLGALVIKFGAAWCAPCRQLDIALGMLEAECPNGAAGFFSIDIEASPIATRRASVMSVPTVVVYQAGQPVKVLRGPRTLVQLRTELAAYLRPASAG